MRLLNAELTRLSKRRLTWFVLLGMLLFVGLLVVSNFFATREPSADQLARQQRWYQEAVTEWELHGEQMQLECQADQERARAENPTADIDYGCDSMGPPQEEWYLYQPPILADELQYLAQNSFEVLAMAALVLGAGFVGAEFISGSMSTWLIFEPRRNRVFITKLIGAAVGVGLATLLSYLLLSMGTWAVCAINGGDLSLTVEQFWKFLLPLFRSWFIITGIGLASAALAFAVRHTAAVIALGLGSVFLVDAMLVQLKPVLTPISLLANSHAAIDGRYHYTIWKCSENLLGEYSCTTIEKVLVWPQATGYLIGLLALLTIVGLVMFQKRDVN